MFVGKGFSLSSAENNYRIAHNYEIVEWDRLTYSLSIMYWGKQEQFLFDIILFILVVFQASTFFMLKTQEMALQNSIFLVGLNFLLFFAMIPYAKWVWKTASYQKPFLQVSKHEIVLLVMGVAGILLGMFMKK